MWEGEIKLANGLSKSGRMENKEEKQKNNIAINHKKNQQRIPSKIYLLNNRLGLQQEIKNLESKDIKKFQPKVWEEKEEQQYKK